MGFLFGVHLYQVLGRDALIAEMGWAPWEEESHPQLLGIEPRLFPHAFVSQFCKAINDRFSFDCCKSLG